MEAPFSFLPESLLQRGLLAATLAVALTAALELTCLDEVRKLCHSRNRSHQALYYSALRTNLCNNLVLGPLAYYVAVHYFCQAPGQLSLPEQLQAMVGIVLVEAVLYYCVHRAFHEVRGLYWMHRYHHQFNTVVVPSSANAVSVPEYGIAYMLPLVAGVAVTRADELSAFGGSAVVAVANLLIHTPWLVAGDNDDTAQSPSPPDPSCCHPLSWLFVTATDHFSHHRPHKGSHRNNSNNSSNDKTTAKKNKKNYGAPVLHVDRILERCSSLHHQATSGTTKTSRPTRE
jgi:sterol desaturase/sphingolipid hydroxylase (fatty acid hydroxylase superfamily)